MKRFGKLRIVLAVPFLLWTVPELCRAQVKGPLPPTVTEIPAVGSKVPGESDQRPSQKSSLELPAPQGGEVVELQLPPLEAGDRRFPINLAAALRLADARPMIVAIAQASAWIAEARLQRAKVLWLPAFMIDVTYMRHDGFGPDFNLGVNFPTQENSLGQFAPGSFGRPLNQNINWFYSGLSFYQVVSLTDAIFQPLAQKQDYNARRWDIQTAKNEALQQTARAYFSVHRFRGRYASTLYTVKRGRELVKAIADQARDLVPAVEIDRARNYLADLEQMAVSARADWRVASAELTRVLRLDPRAVVEPLENDHLQITLIDPSRSLDELIPIGLTNRPELAAQQSLIQASQVRVRQEKMRPLLPIILLTGWETPGGMIPQVGIFGTGPDSKLNNWSYRDDISTQVVWQLQNMGLGNAALIKHRRAEQSQAVAKLFQMQDMVAAEINQAQASVQSAASRVVQAERSLRASRIAYNANVEGLGQTHRFGNVLEQVFRPQEVVYALNLFQQSFNEYFDTVADYNIAQFELFHALGYPARDLEFYRPPGEIVPVDTSRPNYLPPVGTGPPPATR